MKSGTIFLFVLVLFSAEGLFAQTSGNKINIGVELDALPYLTGGYFGAAWIGKKRLRARVLTAQVNKPDWLTSRGFTNHDIRAYALMVDHFLVKKWKGPWAGAGLVYWKSSIQTDAKITTSHFSNLLVNGSAGFNFQLYKKLYLSPWAGINVKVAGDRKVAVDNKRFTLPLFNPEASLKLGYFF